MVERRRIRSFEWSTAVILTLALTAGAVVYLRDGTERFLSILTKDLELFTGMLPKMAAGCLIAAFVTRLLPREVVARVVGAEPRFMEYLATEDELARARSMSLDELAEEALAAKHA